MIDWDKLRTFHIVAQNKSFSAASHKLLLHPSAISRQINALEDSLKIKLFHRHSRGLILTEQGEILFDTVRSIVTRIESTKARLNESRTAPEGRLIVTTTVAIGSHWLAQHLYEFHQRYPKMSLAVIVDDEVVDLTMHEADVAIRSSSHLAPDLIQRRLMTIHFSIYGSKDYIEKRGIPRTTDDLDHHDLLIFGDPTRAPVANINWLVTYGRDARQPRASVLEMNNHYSLYQAVRAGLGLAALPAFIATKDENLVKVLPDAPAPSVDALYVYPDYLRNSMRVQVFRDFLLEKIQQSNF
ncbi:MAG: LysR family transcriptional regulator [Pseudomonadota bacterium]